eukprot:3762751-Ditylum_brightwellii.AAC.2
MTKYNEHNHNNQSIISGTTEQQIAEPQLDNKVVLRNLSIEKESTLRMIKFLPDTTNSRKDKNTKDWTINKLRFNAVGLLGSNNEINILHACWNCMMHPEQQIKEVVMISGYSGTGKTTLAFELKKNINEERGAFVIRKFNQYYSGKPLSGISQTFGELYCMIVKKEAILCKVIEDIPCAELQSEGYLLTHLVPDLKKVIN